MVFTDGSFLIVSFDQTFLFKRKVWIVRFGYQYETDTEPKIYRLSYSYHYQRPTDHFYFRFDHHPDVGDKHTHPLYHLHSAGWLSDATKLQEGPRYEVSEITLAKVLRLILITFPSIRHL